jgi:thiol-disulfide isomerase/thioredoxin
MSADQLFLTFLCLTLALVCESKFADHASAEELTSDNFKSKVINSKEVQSQIGQPEFAKYVIFRSDSDTLFWYSALGSCILCAMVSIRNISLSVMPVDVSNDSYTSRCGHCKALAPEWQKVAEAVSPSIRVGAVDADKYKDIGGQYQVQGFPTIKLFGLNKKAPQDYNGARTAAAISQAAVKLLQDQV